MFLFVDTDRMIAAILTILYNAISPADKGISFINIVTIVTRSYEKSVIYWS